MLDHQFCSYISLFYKIMFFLSFVFYVFLIVIIISLEANTFLENNEMITLSRCFRKIYLLLLTLITVEVYAQINIFKLVFIFKLFYWFVEDLEGTEIKKLEKNSWRKLMSCLKNKVRHFYLTIWHRNFLYIYSFCHGRNWWGLFLPTHINSQCQVYIEIKKV